MNRVLLLILSLLLAIFLVACNDEETKEDDIKDVRVETVEAKEGELVINKTVNGRTSPKSITPVMVQNPGEIDKLEVKNGDLVKEDDLLAVLKTPMGKQNIKASKDGEIANLDAAKGDTVSGEEPLAVIIDMDEVNVSLSVTSDVRSLFKIEDTYDAIIDGDKHKAEVISVSTLTNEAGLYEIEAVIENKEETILPGMIATIQVPEKRIEKAILLPTEAIIEENEGTYIYIVKDDNAVKTEIEIKETQSDLTAIEGEVNEGDQVVVNGQLMLSDGIKVEVVEEGNKS